MTSSYGNVDGASDSAGAVGALPFYVDSDDVWRCSVCNWQLDNCDCRIPFLNGDTINPQTGVSYNRYGAPNRYRLNDDGTVAPLRDSRIVGPIFWRVVNGELRPVAANFYNGLSFGQTAYYRPQSLADRNATRRRYRERRRSLDQ